MQSWLKAHVEAITASAITALVSTVVFALTAVYLRRPVPAPIIIRPITPAPYPTRLPTASPGPIHVYVSGEVLHPGVYTLPWDSRLEAAIAAAGGFTGEADLIRLNLAARLLDEQQILVPVEQRSERFVAPIPAPSALPSPTRISSRTPTPHASQLNLNAASAAELESLPGIGPVLAQRIVEYRTANGGFSRIEDVKKVKGIGDGIFEKIRGLITAD